MSYSQKRRINEIMYKNVLTGLNTYINYYVDLDRLQKINPCVRLLAKFASKT